MKLLGSRPNPERFKSLSQPPWPWRDFFFWGGGGSSSYDIIAPWPDLPGQFVLINRDTILLFYITPFCTPNRHFFIWFRHIAIDFVTISLGLNRGSHYELAHTCLTKRTKVWLGSYNRQRAFNFGRGFSIVKVECRVVDYMTQVELWCTTSFKCALVEKARPVSKLIWWWRIQLTGCTLMNVMR